MTLRRSMPFWARKKSNAFDPLSIGDCELWFDANDNSTFVYRSGSNLENWNDKSGNNRNLSYLTEGATIFEVKTDSGRQVVQKNNSSMWTPSFSIGSFPVTFFMVISDEQVTNGSPISYFTPGQLAQYLAFRYNTGPGLFYSQRNGGGEFVVTTPTVIGGGGYDIWEGVSVQNDLYKIALNGGLFQNGTVSQAYNTNMSRFAVGQLRSSGNTIAAVSTQKYCEILCYSKDLNSAERTQILNYLKNKWSTP